MENILLKFLKGIHSINHPVSVLKGIGAKRALSLQRRGVHTVIDALFLIPLRYEDRTKIIPIRMAEEGNTLIVKGIVKSSGESFISRRRKIFRIEIDDGTGTLHLAWFNYNKRHMRALSTLKGEILSYGKITNMSGSRYMFHPRLIPPKSWKPCYYPIYPKIEGIPEEVLRNAIRDAVSRFKEDIIDPVPEWIPKEFNLPDLKDTISQLHDPPLSYTLDQLNAMETPFHRRLIFDNLLLFILTSSWLREKRFLTDAPELRSPREVIKMAEEYLPFDLTGDQIKAIKEICSDIKRPYPMNRLLMGDVGCGKTVVCAISAWICALNKRQCAIMVPTQILADQHMEYFSSLPAEMGFRPVLIKGNLNTNEKKRIYSMINKGSYNLVIGTHSLIQEGLHFKDLALVIIDEQHRFGLRQRIDLTLKGKSPHLLVMSATPIPRTLSMTLYGDMDISIIKEFPRGRGVCRTEIVKRSRKRWIYEELICRLKRGEQAFVICPLITDSDGTGLKNVLDMTFQLKRLLEPAYRVGLIHGALSYEEKAEIMDKFKRKKISVLVGTTVLELGVHIPDATVMIVEHPERYGLAQLHQLRGRIGRGAKDSICFLVIPDKLNDKALERLKVLEKSNDGFYIAERDMKLRGPGEFTGAKQWGKTEIDLDLLLRHIDILENSKRIADRIFGSDPWLMKRENVYLRMLLERRLSLISDIDNESVTGYFS